MHAVRLFILALGLATCVVVAEARSEPGACVGQRSANAVEAALTEHISLGATRMEWRLCPAAGSTPSVLTLSRTRTRDGALEEGARIPLSAEDYAALVALFRAAARATDSGARSDMVRTDGVHFCIVIQPSLRRSAVCFQNPKIDSARRGLQPVVDLEAELNRFVTPGTASWSKP